MRRTLLLCLMTMLVLVSPVRADAPRYSILVIFDGGHPAQSQAEADMRKQFLKGREDAGVQKAILPIDSYDASVPGQKLAVERLEVPRWQLPFVGICRLEGPNALPGRVVFGAGPIPLEPAAELATTHRTLSFALRTLGLDGRTTAANAMPIPAGQGLGMLVCYDRTSKTQTEVAEKLIAELKQQRIDSGLDIDTLPIIPYYFDNDAQARYCHEMLGIEPDELVFAGLITHQKTADGDFLRRSLVRIPRVAGTNAQAAATALLRRARDFQP